MPHRTIPNDNPKHPVSSLPAEFVEAITNAQVAANKGWAPENSGLVDLRVVNCPDCKAPGMNTCYGVWLFTCGAEVLSDGEHSESCGNSNDSTSEPNNE